MVMVAHLLEGGGAAAPGAAELSAVGLHRRGTETTITPPSHLQPLNITGQLSLHGTG